MGLRSWVESANDPLCDFPIQNLPYGVYRHRDKAQIGIAIGDRILDLRACAENGLLAGLSETLLAACKAELLNSLMALGPRSWSALRQRITSLLAADKTDHRAESRIQQLLIPMKDAEMQIPARIGDYTDFYASIHHATRVGKLFRPDAPLLPNYKYVPIGYHGRASSIVISGSTIRRPCGQIKPLQAEPVFGPTQSLDYELEVGIFLGGGNALGERIPIAEAEQHIFGVCLVNDWSARDIQSWEYQPLGPFLAKSFATTISPWIVPLEALAPYRVPANERSVNDPVPLDYLSSPTPGLDAVDLMLEVYLQSQRMCQAGMPPMQLSKGNLRDLYWTIAQLITHHASNGCNLRSGDLLATGTISGPAEGSEGCLLEKKHHAEPIHLPTGEMRRFLDDGDQILLRGYACADGLSRIGLGECNGIVGPSIP